MTAVGGTALGAGIGYAVGGRAGAFVGGILGAVGGYNVEPLSEAVVARGAVRPAARFSTSGMDRAGNTGRATVVGESDIKADYQARLKAIFYDPNAEMVPSKNGDPWGSYRARRSLEWELQNLSILPDSAEAPVRALAAGMTFGVSEVLVQVIGASRREATKKSVEQHPYLLLWSPDYPPATWPYQGSIKVDVGYPFGDREMARQIELYGPTRDDVKAAAERRAYIAQLNGRRLVASLDDLVGDQVGRFYVR